MPSQPGIRVGALMSADKDTAYLFGYGVFEGYRKPNPALQVQIFGERMEHENPCILLDSGKRVFGCECWWGPEDKIRELVAKYANVVNVDIEEQRVRNRPGLEPPKEQ